MKKLLLMVLLAYLANISLRLKTIRFAIAALQAYQPWIPVERLPARDDANEKRRCFVLIFRWGCRDLALGRDLQMER